MLHIALTIYLIGAAPVIAQTTAAEIHKDSRGQGIEELKKTAAALEESVKLQPGNIDLYIKLGFAYARLEKADESQTAFESAVRLDPKRAIAHYMLGLIYEKKGLREKALAAWKACLENASDPHLRETAAKHLHHLGT
jgi:cytochrome c-type biogenesis protein CcmH/NrfG